MHLLNRYIICCTLLLLCTRLVAQNLQFSDPYLRIPFLKAGEKPEQVFNTLIFLKLVASKNTVYAGEAFLVEYKLYRAVSTEPSPGKQPAFSGCSVVELSPLNDAEIETVNGKQYSVSVLRKVQLTALQDGPLLLDSASVHNVVQYITPENPNEVQTLPLETTSKTLTINVKPLPDTNRPANFTGMVGNFNIAIKADSNTVPAGENTHITVTIKGFGDVAGISTPAVNWPAGAEHFEPTATQHIEHENFPAGGYKSFEMPFIDSVEGTAIVPPVYFTFFNPQTQKYDSIHTDSLSIRITKAQPKGAIHEIISEDITNRKYLWLVPAIALTVTFVLIVTGKTQRKERNKRRPVAEEPKEPLPLTLPPAQKTNFAAGITSLSAVEDDHAFFNKARELLTEALREKINTFAFYEADILQELQTKSHDRVLVETVKQVYKICNQNLYSPIINSEQRATVQEALAEVIKQLEI